QWRWIARIQNVNPDTGVRMRQDTNPESALRKRGNDSLRRTLKVTNRYQGGVEVTLRHETSAHAPIQVVWTDLKHNSNKLRDQHGEDHQGFRLQEGDQIRVPYT